MDLPVTQPALGNPIPSSMRPCCKSRSFVVLLLLGFALLRSETLVVADFNDCALGDMRAGVSSNQPADTGSGFGASYWQGGTGAVQVVAGDLQPAANLGYGVGQGGAAHSVQPRGVTSATRRQQYRETAAALEGEVWGSFLIRQTDETHNTGLTFNVASIDPLAKSGQGRLYVAGRALLVQGFTDTTAISVADKFVLNQTALVLFRLVTSTRRLTVWIDPVLPAARSGLPDATAAYDGACDLVGTNAAIGTLGAGGYPSGATASNGGVLDSIRLSDGAAAYYDVTGLPVVPEISSAPESETVVVGGDASFRVLASGVGALEYQWQKDGIDVPGATQSTLGLANVQPGDAGSYRVRVSEAGSVAAVFSEAAMLTVLTSATPVVITQAPQPLSVVAGQQAVFTVEATGTAPLTYQWHKDGDAIAGATSPTLTIASTTVSDAGNYRVVVRNPAGAVTSAAVALEVHIAPQIVASPQAADSYVGGTAIFFVEATGTGLAYAWSKDGAPVGGDSAYLHFENLSAADAGAYTVTVSNPLGSVTSASATLTLHDPAGAVETPLAPVADSYIENGTANATTHDAQGLKVGARSTTAGGYKTYLAFDLPLAIKAREATSAALTLTLDRAEPLLGSGAAVTNSLLASSAAARIRTGQEAQSQTTLSVGAVTAGTDVFRSLLSFDLSSLPFVPSSVKLRLTVASRWSGAAAGAQMLRLYRVTRDWAPSQVSWSRASDAVAWTNPGGDYATELLAETTADAATVSAGDNVEFPDTPALRQAMLEVLDTQGVLQLLVVSAQENSLGNAVFQFQPRGVAGAEPVLVLPPGTLTNSAPRNPVRLRLHGIANNADSWSETALTWANAPTKAESLVSPGRGAVPLAEITVDAGAATGGTRVAFADARLTQFLNWAAGRRGDLYGLGTVADTDRRVSFIVTSIDTGEIFAGLKFQDSESATAGEAPLLSYTTGTALPGESGILENDRFRVVLQADRTVRVTDKSSGTSANFSAAFEVVSQTASPSFSRLTYTGNVAQISLATWRSNFNYTSAAGERETVRPVGARALDGMFAWQYRPVSSAFVLRATLDLPTGNAFPRLRWTLSPTAQRYFGVSLRPVEDVATSGVAAFFLPGPWSGRRFPENQFVIDEVRATLPAVFRETDGVVSGVAVDPFEVPSRVSTFTNAGFGLIANDGTAALSRPAVLAPLYGSAASRTDGTLNFATRLVVGGAGVDATFRAVATGVFGFRDYRENLPGGSLNTALDNLVDFVLNASGQNYSYWRSDLKAHEYVNDAPEYVRFQSAPAVLGLAMVRDSAQLYEERARPTIEYFISRRNQMLKIAGYDAANGMGGPVVQYQATDFFALYGLMGGRTSAFLSLAQEGRTVSGATGELSTAIAAGQTLSRGVAYDRMFDTLHSLIEGYRATGYPEYLADARWLADEYIRYRYENGAPTDFRDVKSGFWNQVSGRWDSLLEMEAITGDARYAAAAAKALNEFARHISFAPVPDNVTVDGLGTPVKATLVSEVGLTSEGAPTSVSHRGIFMSAYAAPSFMRAARTQQDPFFAAVARSSIIGRWLNYPGYTIRNNYNPVLLRSDYPLRWYSTYANTAHMNHPLSLAAMTVDFLFADAEWKSQGAILFPHHYTDSRAYFRGRVYGGEPGRFYGDEGVWPWMPRALVACAGTDEVQLNYVAGRGNGRLYLAFSNQAPRAVSVAVTVDPARVTFAPGATLREWRDNVAQPARSFVNGVTTVQVPAGGLVAWAIDGATPVLDLQADYAGLNAPALPATSYRQQTTTFGRVVGTVLSLSRTRQHAYVYTDASPEVLSAARLRYQIDGGAEQTQTKAAFPFEFTVSLPAGTRTFSYVVEGTPLDGSAVQTSATTVLDVDVLPEISSMPAAQSVFAGEGVTLQVSASGTGPFTYQWRKEGVAIDGATGATLVLMGTPAEAGSYDVVVSNSHGSVTSASASVSIQLGNLLAYALGKTGRDDAPTPTAALDGATGKLTLNFLRARADLTYTVQGSDNLTEWSVVVVNPGEVGQRVTVADGVTLAAAGKRFLRLRVDLP